MSPTSPPVQYFAAGLRGQPVGNPLAAIVTSGLQFNAKGAPLVRLVVFPAHAETYHTVYAEYSAEPKQGCWRLVPQNDVPAEEVA